MPLNPMSGDAGWSMGEHPFFTVLPRQRDETSLVPLPGTDSDLEAETHIESLFGSRLDAVVPDPTVVILVEQVVDASI